MVFHLNWQLDRFGLQRMSEDALADAGFAPGIGILQHRERIKCRHLLDADREHISNQSPVHIPSRKPASVPQSMGYLALLHAATEENPVSPAIKNDGTELVLRYPDRSDQSIYRGSYPLIILRPIKKIIPNTNPNRAKVTQKSATLMTKPRAKSNTPT